MTRIIANYLPQFHVIPENSKWWGEGYTDWVGVKEAKPLFNGHNQPRIPLGENYYSLDDVSVLQWQAKLAKAYHVYGWGIYHYWFSSHEQLLEKPAELLQSHPEIDIHYMFIWDNASWTRTWSKRQEGNVWAPQFESRHDRKNKDNTEGILKELRYGTELDWKIHFDYLLPFFRDDRYIKIDGKPIFAFFQPQNNYKLLCRMIAYWENLAIEAGFPGIICMSRDHVRNEHFKYKLRYSPFSPHSYWEGLKNKISHMWSLNMRKIRFANYDSQWRAIIKSAESADERTFLSGFVSFDDTPRRGGRARIITECSPEKFQRYLEKLLLIAQSQGKEYLFLTAWNEWGEGAYLEPDETNGYDYLKAVKSAVENIAKL